MFTYKKSDKLQIVRYTESNYVGCIDRKKSTLGYVFLIAGR